MAHDHVLTHQRYLAQLSADARALNAVVSVAPLVTAVPSCPGWSLADLAYHVGELYQHKIAAMRTGERPAPWPPEPAVGIWRLPVPEFLAISAEELLAELSSRDPAQSCWTWYPEDQTVGFWARRMAQETVIHRWDCENAVGEPAPIDQDIAADGIDELLVAFLSGDWSDERQPEPFGAIDISTDTDRWQVNLAGNAVTAQRNPTGTEPNGPDATIHGRAEDLLLALWGRRPLPAVTTGRQALADALQQRLVVVTQ